LENWLRRSVTPDLALTLYEFETEGRHISLLEIPAATHRPVQFNGQEYVRIGSYKKSLKDYPEQEKSLWRLFDRTTFEEQVAAERLDGSAILDLVDYPAYFRLLKLPLPQGREAILARLAQDGMIVQTLDGLWNLLNLGAMLFARDLRDFRSLRRKTVRIVAHPGTERFTVDRELEVTSGYAASFEDLIGRLTTLLPANESIGQALRKEVPMYPELALRELVANALIHQEFTLTGTAPLIEIFPDRLEITNPGRPLMEPERFVDTPPRSRNEVLASFMRRIGACEERGSGIDKVVHLTEEFQLPAPLFEVAGDNTRVVLFAHRPFARMDRQDRIRACYLHACLQYVNRKEMTNSTLRERFGITVGNSAQVTRVINDALSEGLIQRRDAESASRRFASYIPFWATTG
jgi:predicted HTH transcriptional regulator